MDELTKNIKSKVYYLDEVDSTSSITTIPMHFWYENASGVAADKFLPPEIIKASLFKTLEEFPILVGHLKSDADWKTYVDVDRDNLNTPEYSDSYCDVHFQEIKDSGFDTKMLPSTFIDARVIPVPPTLTGSSIKLIRAHVFRFKENSGAVIFIMAAHNIFNGLGFHCFVARWAEISRWMHDAATNAAAVLPTRRFVHDRSIIKDIRSSETDALESSLRNVMLASDPMAKILGWFSPNMRAMLLKHTGVTTEFINCSFHIPTDVIDTLQKDAQEFAPPDVPRYTKNDILVSLITIAIAQSTAWDEHEGKHPLVSVLNRLFFGKFLSEPTEFTTSLPMDMRSHIKCLKGVAYTGNTTFQKGFTTSHELLNMQPSAQLVAELATRTHRVVASINERASHQYFGLLNRQPYGHLQYLLHQVKLRHMAYIANNTRSAFHTVDFGAGTPALVRPPSHGFPNLVIVLPGHPDVGGYEASFTLCREVAERIIKHKYWMSFVDKYDFDV
ncbi:hypothetical protein IW140_002935 [Coemansia sp. RSA 1813]|nr:hypothetical protein EV178_002855 [Coemansia sp. RSA 1646]KAJ1771960.1 hypothetical protein LPJ74_001852 [Coemansia sp. RSA 1843]KAJ2089732.1 hypothetical protein IW138_003188 [Coemansia sp. RSA 986]KAJ2214263.1 hypothetical protein EV179_003165 [Coemansia sp. RSA 487]KAJ2569681.1 hypothetical protein IW140_002935 [Coemansia sp. RSA 1813]